MLIVGLALCPPALIGCSEPLPTDDRAAAPGGATLEHPAEVMVVYQPTQLCPSPQACRQGDELVWVPAGTTLAVVEQHVQELERSTVHWFRVGYEGQVGWISELATDKAPRVKGGKIVRD
jgi:hypothetical protein